MTKDTEIETEYKDLMNALANGIDTILNGDSDPKTVSFVLLVSEFGKMEGGRVNYISNGRRSDIVMMMKETIARFEGQPEMTGQA